MSSQDTARSSLERPANASSEGHNGDMEANRTSNETNSPDDNIVDWDGPDDPENPLRWSKTKKNVHIVIVSIFALVA